jgi:CRISPR-associated protein Cas2
MTIHVIVCYDVKTSDEGGAKRLRRIAEACNDYGVRVQYSVFECSFAEKDWVVLRQRLLEEFDAHQDSLRFYFIDAGDFGRREHHGVREPLDPTGTLLV